MCQASRPRYQASLSGWATIPAAENLGMLVFQLNIKGLTTAKLEIIQQLAFINKLAVVLLQETHRAVADSVKLPGFILAGSILSKKHGLATFVMEQINWTTISQCPPGSNIEWLTIKVQETMFINVHKPPLSRSKQFPQYLCCLMRLVHFLWTK